jgi:hypothetical protein
LTASPYEATCVLGSSESVSIVNAR